MDSKNSVSNYERPYFYTRPPVPPPPPPLTAGHQSHGFNLNEKVSPSVLLIIIILAIIFFVSGLLHLLVRYLMRPVNYRDPDEFDNVTALQGQLQQLFHLHDSGVDQSFIDTLPVFTYKSIIGVKDPFDCAVCLCEFEGEDKLRLLPKCSHAFHIDCIDTWLLSHSTCPLCRGSLLSDFTPNSCCSPIVLVLESGSSEISREIVNSDPPNGSSIHRVNSHMSNEDLEFSKREMVKEDEKKEKVVTIKLGKFKNVDVGVGGEGSSEKQELDGRRCFSMGSFEYVMNEDSSLQVPIRAQVKKQASKKSSLPITPCHRPAMSECGGDSRRDFKENEVFCGGGSGGDTIGKSKRESFSVSKIWLRGKKEKPNATTTASIGPSSRGSFSFRFPVPRNELKSNRRANSELEIGRWEDDQEIQICQWLDSAPLEASNPPSFARRTLLWLMGRQQIKVVHSSSSTNV